MHTLAILHLHVSYPCPCPCMLCQCVVVLCVVCCQRCGSAFADGRCASTCPTCAPIRCYRGVFLYAGGEEIPARPRCTQGPLKMRVHS